MLHENVLLIVCFSFGVRTEPLFPHGVAGLVSSISHRGQVIASGERDEPAILNELVQRSSADLREDLVEEAVENDLKEARVGVWAQKLFLGLLVCRMLTQRCIFVCSSMCTQVDARVT